MKNIYLKIIVIALLPLFFSCNSNDISIKRKKHAEFLQNSPFIETKKLSKSERKSLGLTSDKYFERMWELTMNPELGYPTPDILYEVQEKLNQIDLSSKNYRVPGDINNSWIERGPNNVGGRTKALLFDPNDINKNKVFAGGISGGLWKNNDITNVNSSWELIDFPENVAVSCITVDVNDSNILYLGTGESYTHGAVNGNGVWKSLDGGVTWNKVFGGITGATTFNSNAKLTINNPQSIVGDYAAIQASFGPQDASFSGSLVLVNDGTITPTLGCATLINASSVNGKIAVLDRGSCLFVDKVRYAQAAGAIGVVVINNVDGVPIVMGGDNASDIVIPAVMISKSDGTIIKNQLNNSIAVDGTVNSIDTQISGAYLVPGQTHINDIITRNNNGNTEIFISVGDAFYSPSSYTTLMGTTYQGIYKSTDGGSSWEKLTLPNTVSGYPYTPNDLEVGPDNKIWMSTTRSLWFGAEGGGSVFSSTDGTVFTLKYTILNGLRTEIAVSKTNPNKVYVLSDINSTSSPVAIYKTTDGFNNVSTVTLPVDGYSGIPSNDFTNGQGFYDLAIDVDPSNDETVFVAGIDWFKSLNGGTSWTQITAGYGGTGSSIHPDQHGITFANSSKIIIGCDGGVAYSSNGGTTFESRINNYNTLQFYHMGVAPTALYTGDYFIAGSQDNGTQLFENAPAGIGSSVQAYGGDGGFCFFDQTGTTKYYITSVYYNNYIRLYNYNTSSYRVINNETTEMGDFITQQALDSKADILFTNYSDYTVPTYQIRRYKSLLTGTVTKVDMTGSLASAPTALKVSPFTSSSVTNLYVGTEQSKLYKVAGAQGTSYSFSDITGSEFLGSISDIEFGSSELEIFVTMFNYGVKSIWYTSNGGLTWKSKEGDLPDIPVNTILRNPLKTEEVIIGTDLGVWWTQDFSSSSPTWYRADNGMKNVKVTDLELRDDNTVFAATYGRGIFSAKFTTADGTVGLDDISEKSISLYPNPAKDFTILKSSVELNNPVIYIYDNNGRLVKTYKYDVTGYSYKIYTDSLSTGIYVIKATSANKTFTHKLIVE